MFTKHQPNISQTLSCATYSTEKPCWTWPRRSPLIAKAIRRANRIARARRLRTKRGSTWR